MYMAVVVAAIRSRRALSTALSTATMVAALSMPCLVSAQSSQGMVLDAISDVRARDAIRGVITEARGRGVPEGPLYSKVREGVAKQASPDLIVGAVRTLAEHLERAQTALAPVQAVDEVSAGAGALRVGVPDATLRGMRQSWPDKTLTVPLGVLTELVANDIPAKKAAERVHALLVRGASSADIVTLGDKVRADIAAGHAPDASMELRTKGVLSLIDAQAAVSPTFELRTNPRKPVRPPR